MGINVNKQEEIERRLNQNYWVTLIVKIETINASKTVTSRSLKRNSNFEGGKAIGINSDRKIEESRSDWNSNWSQTWVKALKNWHSNWTTLKRKENSTSSLKGA